MSTITSPAPSSNTVATTPGVGALVDTTTAGSVNASEFLAVGADRHLTPEELNYAGDLLASQGRALKDAEAQARSLDLLCTELTSHMQSLGKRAATN